ncbi:MAG TPA: cytochrome c oxidase subunit II [Croceibacterium sp.]|nr:cytochrome c oxidase subunit II [Croceibacterium sp.]
MKRAAPLLLVLCGAGCGGSQSVAGRDGVQGALIGGLFDVFLWTTAAVYLFVLAYLALALVRGRRHRRDRAGAQGEPAAQAERIWHIGLIAFAGATALILAGLTVATWLTDRALAEAGDAAPLEIEVIGHQWWWEVRYQDPVASRIVRTANELHLPAGRAAHITLKSTDVIHSLWIPNLAGKQDLIPGRIADLSLHPLRTGVFRAQCAEFCGLQHARMALDVTVETPAEFARWYDAQLVPPPAPTGGAALAGFALFQNRQCASCHAVAGTPASGMVAPDLSHVASRRTIAAGTLPTTRDNLMAWVADPQAVKPGNNMPKVPLTEAELAALGAYLETLK